MLGWIRACRREFSYLRVANRGGTRKVENAIDEFEKALADGTEVERLRVKELCELWRLCKSEDVPKIQDVDGLGTKVDNLIWDHLENGQVEDLSNLDEESRRALCRSVADCLCSHMSTNKVIEQSMMRSWPDAFAILSIREAWIYKDWQSAIGDVMIQKCESDNRRFEVIGFGDFELLILSDSPKQQSALRRMLQLFDELDLSIEDRFDARPTQLRAVARANARLVLAIDEIQGLNTIVPKYSREKARKILAKF